MFCNNCGARVPDDALFCQSCGTKLDNSGSRGTQDYPNYAMDVQMQNDGKGKKPNAALIVVGVIVAVIMVSYLGFLIIRAVNPCLFEHDWQAATCTEAETCTVCGQTQGESLGHYWEPATCTSEKICRVCGKTEGGVLEHSWIPATENDPARCSSCGKMTALERPATGTVFDGKDRRRASTILLKNENQLDCYVVLKDTDFNVVYSFYIRAGEEKYMSVPSGQHYLFLSQGKDWYGPNYYFGDGTEPRIDSDLLDFNKYWWTYTVR